MKVKANFTVRLTVTVDGAWEESCPISQVKKQALEMAKRQLNDSLAVGKDRYSNVSIELESLQ